MKTIIRLIALVIGLSEAADGLGQSTRIVGGTEITQDWPWMARIVHSEAEDALLPEGLVCGATLIDPYWVVTAAHCLDGAIRSDIDVVLGAHSVNQTEEVLRLPVAEIHLHPDYTLSPLTLDNDIALVLLAKPAEGFTPIPLVTDDSLTSEGTLAKILGWGAIDEFGISDPPLTLQEADLPIVSLETANQPRSHDGRLTPTMLPAGYHKGRVDACRGDSGGPLVVPDETGSGWKLAGVTSFGDRCGAPFQYGVYSRISALRAWILNFIHPEYGAWERKHGVLGERRDPDGDGWNNLAEFAANSNPLDPNSTGALAISFPDDNVMAPPTLAFRQRLTSRSLTTRFSFSPDLRSWQAINANEITWQEESIDEATVMAQALLPALNPSNNARYFRKEVSHSDSLEPFIVPLEIGRIHEWNLIAEIPKRPDTDEPRRFRDIAVSLPMIPQDTTFHVVSDDFSPRLELLHPSRGRLRNVRRDHNAEQDRFARIQFSSNGIDYLLRVSSTDPDASGRFEVRSLYFPSSTIQPGSRLFSSLREMNRRLRTRFGKNRRVDAVQLTGIQRNQRVTLSLTTEEFPSVLELIDGQTGETLEYELSAAHLGGRSLDSTIVTTALEPDGNYIVLVTSSGDDEIGAYQLTVQSTTVPTANESDPPQIQPGETFEGTLSMDGPRRNGPLGQAFAGTIVELAGLLPNQDVVIDMMTEDFEPLLWLIDGDNNDILLENDRTENRQKTQITFSTPEVPEATHYRLFATSTTGEASGDFSLSVSAEDADQSSNEDIVSIGVGTSVEGRITTTDTTLSNSLGFPELGDRYELVGIEPQQILTIDLQSDDFDAYLWLINAEDGSILLEDDDSGSSLNSRIQYLVPENLNGPTYHLFVSSASGFSEGTYVLTTKTEERVETPAIPIAFGESVQGQITSNDARLPHTSGALSLGDQYELVGLDVNRWLTIDLAANFDAYLWLIDVENNIVLQEDDNSGIGTDSRLFFRLPEDRAESPFNLFVTSASGTGTGQYSLIVSDSGSPTNRFEPLSINSTVSGEIEDEDLLGRFDLGDEFVIAGLEPNTRFTLTLEAPEFRSRLVVRDLFTGAIISGVDEFQMESTALTLSLMVLEPDKVYRITVTSVFGFETGAYQLTTQSHKATVLETGTPLESSLGENDPLDPDYAPYDGVFRMEEYILGPFNAGERVQARMTSTTFQGEIYILDARTGETIAWSRETASPDIAVSFVATPNITYGLRATSKEENVGGDYQLSVHSTPALDQQ